MGLASLIRSAARLARAGLGLLVLSTAVCARAEPPVPAACAPTQRTFYAPWVFFGNVCRGTCREQKAGFAWAERGGIANPGTCADLPAGRREGCRAYVEHPATPELAGFEWARENEVGDACECGGAGPAFEAGCRAYLGATGD